MTVAVVPSPTVEVLEYVGVPRGQVHGQLGRLVVLLAQRYGLDPALKHVEVIPARGGLSVYITADGWRFLANRSGMLDGLTFRHVERGEHGWRATVRVWKKGCTHPFDGRAGCGFAEKHDDPEAVAMTRATRRALRNAFADAIRVDAEYAGAFDADDDDGAGNDDDPEPGVSATLPRRAPGSGSGAGPEPDAATPAAPASGSGNTFAGSGVAARSGVRPTPTQADAHRAVGMLTDREQTEFLARHGIERFGDRWPASALDEVAGGVDVGKSPAPPANPDEEPS